MFSQREAEPFGVGGRPDKGRIVRIKSAAAWFSRDAICRVFTESKKYHTDELHSTGKSIGSSVSKGGMSHGFLGAWSRGCSTPVAMRYLVHSSLEYGVEHVTSREGQADKRMIGQDLEVKVGGCCCF